MPGIGLSAGDNMISDRNTKCVYCHRCYNGACTVLCVKIEEVAAVNFAWVFERFGAKYQERTRDFCFVL